MTGSVQRKGKIYYAIIALNGKRKWIRGGPTKKDAQRKLNERLGEVEAGTYKELPKTTFAGSYGAYSGAMWTGTQSRFM